MRTSAWFALQAVAALGLIASPAQGADAWQALGPNRIGTLFKDVSGEVSLRCRDNVAARICSVSSKPATFDGVPVQRIEAVFESGRLQQVRVTLGTEHYEAVLRSFSARYGPGDDRSFQAIAGMGGDFTAGVTVGRAEAVSLVLEQYAGKIDRSLLTYGAVPMMDELLRKTRSYARGARRDL
jgi:hypothetical protein